MKFKVALVTLEAAGNNSDAFSIREQRADSRFCEDRTKDEAAGDSRRRLSSSKRRSQQVRIKTHCSRYFARSGLVGLLVTTTGWLMLACWLAVANL
jgi:hypothetical protein